MDLQSVLSHVRGPGGFRPTRRDAATPSFPCFACRKFGTYRLLDSLIRFPGEHFNSLFECKAGQNRELATELFQNR